MEQLENELAAKNKQLRDKDDEIRALKDELGKYKFDNANAGNELNGLKQRLSEAILNLTMKDGDTNKLKDELDKLKAKNKLTEAQMNDLIANYESRIRDAENEIRNLRRI